MQRERWAVSALFLTNGALFASVLPRLPEIKADLGLSDGELGLALLGIGAGGLLGSLSTRWVLPRAGSRWSATGATVLLAAALPLVAIAPTGAVLFVMLAAYGVADAVTDVSMNVSGVEAQRRAGRTLLNSMHGVWSIGAVGGGLGASLAAGLDIPLLAHLGGVAVACGLLAVLVARAVPNVTGTDSGRSRQGGVRIPPRVALLCGLAVVAALVEAAPYSWSAIYLAEHTGASPAVAGLGFTAFTAAMVLTRLVADKVVDRVGPVLVVRAGGLVSAASLGVALAVGGTWPGIAAFALLGLGSAAVFPAMITAAGALPGQALQAVNMATRVGFLAAPPVIGLLADGVELPLALGLLVVPAALCLTLAASAVRPANTAE